MAPQIYCSTHTQATCVLCLAEIHTQLGKDTSETEAHTHTIYSLEPFAL